ncbi:RNA polymerase sigma-70 factor [uncultured Chitinophaga sp.]|uniref:RNA polymerase sigma-70 factor n=1 Tax=uncultured Chitinophaga sp. TaxID=339340 RepID=UPI0025D81A13|nr:RNA polymerase sigma-70 factor [uncultured Chitinophaga sp.]
MINNELIRLHFRSICTAGDMTAYDELYRLLYSKLVHFSAAIVGSFHLAEEIVSDVFIIIWQKRQELAAVENPVVYIYVSTRNRSLNALQQQKRHRYTSLELLDTDALAMSPDPEHSMISVEIIQKIEMAIRSLPDRCQLIFRLVKQDGLRYKDVAELLDISPKTVDAQLAIAVKKVAAAIRLDMPLELAQAFLFH